jgi:anaerobic magnesium-protoporphyrin IX monomethyl ester cyclase
MKTHLLFPPPGDPTRPCLTLPALTAYLRQAQVGPVVQRDLALEAYLYLFDPTWLQAAAASLSERMAELDRTSALSGGESSEYVALAKALLIEPYVRGEIANALRTLRDWDRFFDAAQYLRATQVFRRAHEIVSARYYPARFSFLEYFDYQPLGVTPRCSAEIEAAVADLRRDPFLEFFRCRVAPGVAADAPDLIGISVTFPAQLVPALSLARVLKAASPRSHICLGGAMVTYFSERPSRLSTLLRYADSLVLSHGEQPLLEIARRIERRQDLAGIPGVVCRGGSNPTAGPQLCANLNDLPTPDYEGMPLAGYLAPTPVLSIAATRGCYWGKCAFCTRLDEYEQRHTELVLADIERLRDRHGAKGLAFVGDVMPPKLMFAIAEAAAKWPEPPIWFCDARFEPYFTAERCQQLYAGGCRGITIGLESGSERVLRHMKKGTNPRQAGEILAKLAAAGIAVRVASFIGFPTETSEEARETVDFIRRNRPHIYTATCGRFVLEERSPCFREPAAYGITGIEQNEEDDFALTFPYHTAAGMDAEEIEHEWRSADAELRGMFLHRTTALSGVHLIFQVDRFGLDPSPAGREPKPEPVPLSDAGDAILSTAPGVVVRQFGWDVEHGIAEAAACPQLVRSPRKYFAYDGVRGRFSSFGPAAHAILRACDGRTPVRKVLERFAEADRPGVHKLVMSLVQRGLLVMVLPGR